MTLERSESTHLYEKLLFVAGNTNYLSGFDGFFTPVRFGFFTQPTNQLNMKRFDSLDCCHLPTIWF